MALNSSKPNESLYWNLFLDFFFFKILVALWNAISKISHALHGNIMGFKVWRDVLGRRNGHTIKKNQCAYRIFSVTNEHYHGLSTGSAPPTAPVGRTSAMHRLQKKRHCLNVILL